MDTFLSHIDTLLKTSLLSSLVVAYLGGVLASLTPCVYPMIPITAGVIGHANIGGSKLRGFFLSLTYVTGMALTYAALGIFAAATGRFFGTVNSSPWTFLLVGNIILLFGLGMLGVFHLPLIGGRFASRGLGMAGIFLAGVTSALVAGPCTTPVLGTLLAYTASSRSLAAGGAAAFCLFFRHGRPVARGGDLFQLPHFAAPIRALDGEDPKNNGCADAAPGRVFFHQGRRLLYLKGRFRRFR